MRCRCVCVRVPGSEVARAGSRRRESRACRPRAPRSGRPRGYQRFRISAEGGRGTGRTTGRMCRCGTVRAEVIMGTPSHRAARPPMGPPHTSRWGVSTSDGGSAASRPSDEPAPPPTAAATSEPARPADVGNVLAAAQQSGEGHFQECRVRRPANSLDECRTSWWRSRPPVRHSAARRSTRLLAVVVALDPRPADRATRRRRGGEDAEAREAVASEPAAPVHDIGCSVAI